MDYFFLFLCFPYDYQYALNMYFGAEELFLFLLYFYIFFQIIFNVILKIRFFFFFPKFNPIFQGNFLGSYNNLHGKITTLYNTNLKRKKMYKHYFFILLLPLSTHLLTLSSELSYLSQVFPRMTLMRFHDTSLWCIIKITFPFI